MAKVCYRKVFYIDSTKYGVVTFSSADISSLKNADSCFWCGDSDIEGFEGPPTPNDKVLDSTVLANAIKQDLRAQCSMGTCSDLYTNATLQRMFKDAISHKPGDDKRQMNTIILFDTQYTPKQLWQRVDTLYCSDAVCSEIPYPLPSPPPPVEPPTPTNKDSDCFTAMVNVTKSGVSGTEQVKLQSRDKNLPKTTDLNTTTKILRYMVDTTVPDSLKTPGSISVTFTEGWQKITDSVCEDMTIIGISQPGSKCGAPEGIKFSTVYVKLPSLFPSTITIARKLDVKNYQSKLDRQEFQGFNAFFVDCFRKGTMNDSRKSGIMSMDPYAGTEKSTVKPWKSASWVNAFDTEVAVVRNYVKQKTEYFKQKHMVVLHSTLNDPDDIEKKPRYIPSVINAATAVPVLQITTVPMVFRIPFTARFSGQLQWTTKRGGDAKNDTDEYYEVNETEPSLIGYIKVVVRVPCVHSKNVGADYDVWRCNVTSKKRTRSTNEDGTLGSVTTVDVNTVDTILMPAFFHHYRPVEGGADNDLQRSVEEFSAQYWGYTAITTKVNPDNFPAGYTGHLTIPELWELALSKATVHMKKMPGDNGAGFFDGSITEGGVKFLNLKGLRTKIEKSMDLCDCVDDFKLTGGWQIIFKNIANIPTSNIEYNTNLATFTLSSSDEFESVNDLIKVDKQNDKDIENPIPKYIYRSGADSIIDLNFKPRK